MAESLANKYRPQTLEDIVSQSSIVKILQRQCELQEYKHAYLFVGSSGVGKTTIAKALARRINGSLAGVEELDAASNNGVENVRNLLKAARERAIGAKYKIFIIDECHALSLAGWQAFLKGIEEPPEFTIYMFCTTDVQKVPPTIINRCQRYNLAKISADKIEERLRYICKEENFTNYAETCAYISKTCGGGMRDAISLLEKAASFSRDLSIENALEALGTYSYTTMFELVNAIIDGRQDITLRIIDLLSSSGKDLKLFIDQFFGFTLDITKYCLFKSLDLLTIPSTEEEALKNSTNFDNAASYYMVIVDKLLTLKNAIKNEVELKSVVEAHFLKMCRWE